MNPSATALAAIAIQQSLFLLLWLIAAWAGISRRPTLWWALAVGLLALGAGGYPLRPWLPPWLGMVGPNLLVICGVLSMTIGIQHFTHRPPRLAWYAVALAAYAVTLTALLQLHMMWAWYFLVGATPCVVLAMTARLVVVGLVAEFGRIAARAMAAPFALCALLFLVRVVGVALWPEQMAKPVQDSGSAMVITVLAIMFTGLLLNLSLGTMVVARVLERLRHHSHHDVLTGLLNRRALTERLLAEHQRLARGGAPYAVLSVDIDHFKGINDRFGHPVGDEVLVAVAHTLRESARQIDAVGRSGGEEFWLLLPATGADGAQQMAERLLRAVRTLAPPAACAGQPLSVSVGVAVAIHGEPQDALMRRLDAALYRAKQRGRDRAEMAGAYAPAAHAAAQYC